MSHFQELTEYKNNIMFKLITNENLLKALVNNNKDFINQSLPENFSPSNLIYSNIYPYRHVPSITTDPKTFITMSFTNFDYRNNEFKSGVLSFFIITHSTLASTDYGLRYDYILSQIDQMFNKQYGVGAFRLNLVNGGDLQVNEEYFGSMISYKFVDFQ